MTLTDRDKKIVRVIFPVLLVAACWFLLLAPKRSTAADLGEQLAAAQAERDAAVAQASGLDNAKANYAKDYETVVRLGKAIPPSVDMPSLLVQLDRATRGTGIRFGKVVVGPRTVAVVTADPAAPPGAEGVPAAAPGGDPAQTGPGTVTEGAGEAVQTSDQASAAAGADAAPTEGTTPPAAADDAAAVTAAGTAAPGLDTVPLDFSFSGGFFEMADFFHEMKRFVFLADRRVRVHGRLMQIDGFSFEATNFPTIKAEVKATVYLAPKSEGVTAGATPAGPTAAGQAAAVPAPVAPAPDTAVPVETPGGVQ